MAHTTKPKVATFVLSSPAFEDGEMIPRKHAFRGEGQNVSPPLSWGAAPAGTREWALVCDDPDAPRREPWVHWILYGLPATATLLPEGSAGGAREGRNDFGDRGWGGPMPPQGHGTHHYHFRLYALDAPVTLPPGANRAQLSDAISGHVVAEGHLIGTYQR